jgi:O-antigen/teichoic acid export membrane protein
MDGIRRSSVDRYAAAPLFARLGRGAAVGGALKLVSVALAFLFFLVLSHAMSVEAFGVFSAAYSLAVGFSYFAMVGQHVAILRFWPSIEEKLGAEYARGALRRSLFLTVAGGVLTALAVALLGFSSSILAILGGNVANLRWTALLILAAALSEFAASAMRARGWLVLALAPRDIGWRLAVILFILFLAHPLPSEVSLGIVTVALFIFCSPQLAILAVDAWRYRAQKMPEQERSGMQHATWGFWANTSISPIFEHSTTVLVAAALGPVAAGAFFAADRLARLLSIPLDGIELIGGPMLARSFHAGRMNEVRLVLGSTSGLAFLAAAAGAICFLIFGKFALALFDPTYVAVFPVLLVLVAGQIVNAVCGSNSLLLNMAGRERDLLAIRAVWGLISVVGVYFAALHAGMIGAAVASAGALAGWNITAVLVCKKRFNISTVFFEMLSLIHFRSASQGPK